MKHVMIDLETGGIAAGSRILTMAAQIFDIVKTENIKTFSVAIEHGFGESFYRRIDHEDIYSCDSEVLRLVWDEDTRKWWNKQGENARFEAFTNEDRKPVSQVFKEFIIWWETYIGNEKNVSVWSHGSSFDIMMMEHMFRNLDKNKTALFEVPLGIGYKCPWNYWQVRDTRTLYAIAGLLKEAMHKPVVKHHALEDAKAQVYNVWECYMRLWRHKDNGLV